MTTPKLDLHDSARLAGMMTADLYAAHVRRDEPGEASVFIANAHLTMHTLADAMGYTLTREEIRHDGLAELPGLDGTAARPVLRGRQLFGDATDLGSAIECEVCGSRRPAGELALAGIITAWNTLAPTETAIRAAALEEALRDVTVLRAGFGGTEGGGIAVAALERAEVAIRALIANGESHER